MVGGWLHLLIQQVRHRVGVLGQRRRKQHTLVQLAHLFQELVDVRSLQDVHLVHGSVYLNWHYEIGVWNWLQLEREMDEKATISKLEGYYVGSCGCAVCLRV